MYIYKLTVGGLMIFNLFIGDWLGIPAPPPFLDPTTAGNRILGGVNYASAAGGILDESGSHYVTFYLSDFGS